ncbi:hypothetical protein [Pontibacter rugosus]
MKHTMNHHSYPVIHHFHNSQPKLSVTPAIVLLDEAYQLLGNALQQGVAVDEVKMSMLQTALDAYLEVVREGFLKNASPNGKAPAPELEGRRRDPAEGEGGCKALLRAGPGERRKLLTTLLEMDGWSWREVYQPE